MSDKETLDKYKKKIDSEINKFKKLEGTLYDINKSEAELSKNRKSGLEDLKQIKESNKELQKIYDEFRVRMLEIEKKREAYLNNVSKNLIPVTTYYYKDLLVKKKKELEGILTLSKDIEKTDKEKKKAEEKKEDNVSNLNKKKSDLENKKNNDTNTFQQNLCKFEGERVNDNKYLYLHLIHDELEYHCSALSILSRLFQTINSIDPRIELPNFKSQYHITADFKEVNIDIDKIEQENKSRKKIQEENEKKKRNEVFDEPK